MNFTITTLALAAVFIVLCLGLFNMMRAGSASRSQMLMRWRVGVQFAAILIVLLLVWWQRG